MEYPKKVLHWLSDNEVESASGKYFEKFNPATGEVLAQVVSGNKDDVNQAVSLAEKAFWDWSSLLVSQRAEILKKAGLLLQERSDEAAEIVALESGKPKKQAIGEIEAAAKCGLFFCDQLQAFEGEILESATPGRKVKLVRQSIGVGALIVPFNNPMAGIAWKTFPALLCGNAVILKSHGYTPYIAVWFGKILKEAGLPRGVFSVLQGTGVEVGAPLVGDSRVKFVSLTGSVKTGQSVLKATADRLAKVCIEAGGKNPFVVCDDANLEKAVNWAVASAFVDGGQRCAAASRLIIFDAVYEEFRNRFLEKIKNLKVGANDGDDFGAIISEKRLNEILADVEGAVGRGAKLLVGGHKLAGENYQGGYFMEPTVLENVSPEDEISRKELFGPVVILYRVKDLEEAILLANNSELKLSGAIHTQSHEKAGEFVKRYVSGVVRVNGPTHGSEPHFPFGGVGLSGNGWREPGVKGLDFYSNWRQVSFDYDPQKS